MRYFCGTSDTSNTANSSDASKTSASVTRLSNYSRKNIASNITLGFKLKKRHNVGWLKSGKGQKCYAIAQTLFQSAFLHLTLYLMSPIYEIKQIDVL